MAKRENGAKDTADAMEERVVAFAEQLGRIVGTVQAKTDGWMDRDALRKQMAQVRDGAADLIERLADAGTGVKKEVKRAAGVSTPPANRKGRSGGMVDAPGKKHRKPMPRDPRAVAADAKRSTVRSGKASMKTVKLRGRG